MQTKALETLEYHKIIKMLEENAVSGMAKERIASLLPLKIREDIEQAQQETADALSCLLRYGSIPLSGLTDVRPALQRTAYGGVLGALDLLHVGELLHVAAKVKKYAKSENRPERYETLEALFTSLEPVKMLEAEINRCILSENDIADDASAGLRSIRKEIKGSNERIKTQLGQIIHSNTYKNMLQDPVVTMRGGRYCVPVKQEYRNAFNGMIHDQSATGATVFMEPMSVVNLNNRIKELEAGEKAEIEKILAALSAQVFEHHDCLETNLQILAELDFMFAKGNLALSMNAVKPIFSNYIDIKKARHPLLGATSVVPTDIVLGKDFTTLLITGPNTGGKTVFLKTIGLFSLMGQAGLHIPSFDNPVLHVYDAIFADIGDEQSIEQNLSTFSSHVSNIVQILQGVTPNCLVLFDELGAGTDPTEGAALAMAIITLLHEQGIHTVVTTHYSELKVFAIATDGIENGSCEFDVHTLRPTYKFLIGIPGKSNAFAIAKRLGIEDNVIERAKVFISKEDARLEDVITDLEISKRTAELEKERAEQFRIEAQRLKHTVEDQKERLVAQREHVLKEAKAEAFELIKKANEEAEGILKEMRKAYQEGLGRGAVESGRKRLRESMAQAYTGPQENRPKGKTPENLAVGDHVYVTAFNQAGTVIAPPDKSGKVLVQTGMMKIDVHLSGLEMDESPAPKSPPKQHTVKRAGALKNSSIKSELDLRGLSLQEAIDSADKYLDDVYLSGLKQVSLIHGKGTGVLRNGMHKYLAKNPRVKGYRLGVFGEGDTGVTIVDLM